MRALLYILKSRPQAQHSSDHSPSTDGGRGIGNNPLLCEHSSQVSVVLLAAEGMSLHELQESKEHESVLEMMYVLCTFICERFFDSVLFLGLAISYTRVMLAHSRPAAHIPRTRTRARSMTSMLLKLESLLTNHCSFSILLLNDNIATDRLA